MKIAMISGWHVHAKGYAKEALAIPGVEIKTVWDEDPVRGEKWADELGCDFVADYAQVMADEEIDGVVIDAPTSMHADLMIQAAKAGKHIFTEKVLTLEPEDAEAVREAVKESGVRFVISFPHRARRELLFLKKLAEEGTLGNLSYARVHNCHNGSSADWLPPFFYDATQTGGGAMVDLGAHGMYLLPWLLGEPLTVQSTFTEASGRGVEDNAVSVLTFKNGAIGVAETGFIHSNDPMTIELVGTKGSAIVRGDDPVMLCGECTGGVWEEILNSDLPVALPSAMKQFVNAFELEMGTLFDIDDAVALTKVMKAAYKAAESGCTVTI